MSFGMSYHRRETDNRDLSDMVRYYEARIEAFQKDAAAREAEIVSARRQIASLEEQINWKQQVIEAIYEELAASKRRLIEEIPESTTPALRSRLGYQRG